MPVQAKCLADDTFDPVTANSIAHLFLDTDTQTTGRLVTVQIDEGKPFTVQPFPAPVHQIKFTGFPEKTGLCKSEPLHTVQAESRLRPLARRLLITACPARVLIRLRKPWVRLRLMLLG